MVERDKSNEHVFLETYRKGQMSALFERNEEVSRIFSNVFYSKAYLERVFGLGLCCFQHYFSYIVAVSFIVEGNRSTQIKPLTNFITYCCIEYTST